MNAFFHSCSWSVWTGPGELKGRVCCMCVDRPMGTAAALYTGEHNQEVAAAAADREDNLSMRPWIWLLENTKGGLCLRGSIGSLETNGI